MVNQAPSKEGSMTNFQKKITPWDLLIQSEEEISRQTIQVYFFLSFLVCFFIKHFY